MSCRQLETEIRTTFGVQLIEAQVNDLETVGQVHDLVRTAFVKRLEDEPQGVCRSVSFVAARRAVSRVTGINPAEIQPETELDNLLPRSERRLTWAALNRELDGILPKKLELPSGASCSASCAGLICGVLSMFAVPLTLTRVMHNHVTLPPWLGLILWAVNWALCWVVIHILWASKAVEIPWDLRTVADVAVWWRGAVWRGKSSLPDGERELWHLLRKIIADVSGCEAKYITRETQLIDLGIE